MAGYYYYDPFYPPPAYKLVSLDELFNSKEPKCPVEKDPKKTEEKKENDDKKKTQTVEIKVYLCCDNCETKVRDVLRDMEGVDTVECCHWDHKVTVKGDMKPDHVLKRVRKVKKDADFWPKKKQK